MDEKNPLYNPEYPEWKKVLWGAGRAFVAAFVPVMGFMLMNATAEDFSCWENAQKFLLPIAIASFAAGVVGLGKWLRDMFPESSIVQRLPI